MFDEHGYEIEPGDYQEFIKSIYNLCKASMSPTPREKEKTMSDQLTITKEKVLEAASQCSMAKETLEILFPEAFEDDRAVDVKSSKFRKDDIMDRGFHLLWKNEHSFCLDSDRYAWSLERIKGFLHLVPRRK